MNKYGHLSYNWFEGLLNKMGGEDGAQQFLRGERVLASILPYYQAIKEAAYLDVTSTGKTSERWMRSQYKNKKGWVTDGARQIILQNKHTTDRILTRVAIIKSSFFSPERTTDSIVHRARLLRYGLPTIEVAGLVAEKLRLQTLSWKKDLGFSERTQYVFMHEPVGLGAIQEPNYLRFMEDGKILHCIPDFASGLYWPETEFAFVFIAAQARLS